MFGAETPTPPAAETEGNLPDSALFGAGLLTTAVNI